MAPQLGWIGLGNMGRGMCKNLVEKGKLSEPLIIFNRTQSKAEDLSKKLGHSTVAGSISDLVKKCDIVFYCLGDDASVLENVEKMLQTDVKNKIVVDCSTIHPDTTKKENDMITKAGGQFVAMPVFGAPAMADAGNLVCVLAGPKECVEKVKPYTKGVMGRADIDYSGQEPSQATLLKVIGNTFILSMVTTLAEGHTVAEKSGLGSDELHKFIEVMFPGPYTTYSNRMVSGDYFEREEPLFAVDLAKKDARHAQKVAKDSGARFRTAELGDEYLSTVKEEKGAKGDIAGIYGAVRKQAGLPYDNK
ncbi:hypothetical protein LTR66_016003 [Elasticomyces elasticus]|nr:hypothetical protein LTR66_016003 [Elasticomyces elasticus]